VVLTGFYSRKGFEAPLRRIKFNDPKTGKRLVFLTNNFALPALTIAQLYRLRWRVELFFKWIKQHLRIKAFFGTTENAVKTQIWIAVSVYVLVAIVKKRLNCSASLYEMLQILSLTMFERTPINQLLSQQPQTADERVSLNQLSLFNNVGTLLILGSNTGSLTGAPRSNGCITSLRRWRTSRRPLASVSKSMGRRGARGVAKELRRPVAPRSKAGG
jgi:hypothetical protein